MNRAAFRRFEFFDVETIAEDIAAKLVRYYYLLALALGGLSNANL